MLFLLHILLEECHRCYHFRPTGYRDWITTEQ